MAWYLHCIHCVVYKSLPEPCCLFMSMRIYVFRAWSVTLNTLHRMVYKFSFPCIFLNEAYWNVCLCSASNSYTPHVTMLPITGYGAIVCDCFALVTEVRVTKPILSISLFSNFSVLSNSDLLLIEYHINIWELLPEVSCGDTRQIWMWHSKNLTGTFAKTKMSSTEKLTNKIQVLISVQGFL